MIDGQLQENSLRALYSVSMGLALLYIEVGYLLASLLARSRLSYFGSGSSLFLVTVNNYHSIFMNFLEKVRQPKGIFAVEYLSVVKHGILLSELLTSGMR